MEIILLWSGIVAKAKAVVRHLLGERLFSGWGVRTLAVGEGRYNPIGYHVGAIWPFENSFIAWGCAAMASRRKRRRSPPASWRPRSSSTVGSPRRSAATHAR
jgi:glycogen debranching enzyme